MLNNRHFIENKPSTTDYETTISRHLINHGLRNSQAILGYIISHSNVAFAISTRKSSGTRKSSPATITEANLATIGLLRIHSKVNNEFNTRLQRCEQRSRTTPREVRKAICPTASCMNASPNNGSYLGIRLEFVCIINLTIGRDEFNMACLTCRLWRADEDLISAIANKLALDTINLYVRQYIAVLYLKTEEATSLIRFTVNKLRPCRYVAA